MSDKDCVLVDYITGATIPDTGAEANRQEFARFLVEKKGYAKEDIERDVLIELEIQGETYRSHVDLAIRVAGKIFMAVKCAAGSLGSWEREILSASRLLESYQIPYAVVTDGRNALLTHTVSGEKKGEGLETIPAQKEAEAELKEMTLIPYPEGRKEREKIIFRSFDTMNINKKG